MKYLRSFFTACLALTLFSGCTDGFEELNTRPDALIAENVDASLLGQAFAQSQYTAMHGLNWRFQISENLFSDIYANYFATTQPNFDSDRYVEVGRWIDLAWLSFYEQAAPQIKFVEDLSAANGLDVQNAMAKVWKVQAYHRQTDYWGPIVYTAFGNGETSVPYDAQPAIYNNFFMTLDSAVTVLKANAGDNAFGNNDLVFAGDVDKWLRFANSLRLRLAMRIRYADPARAQQEAEKAVDDGVMQDNGDNAYVLTTINNRNPFFTITDWGEFRMSADMESILKGYEDPRAPEYFSEAVDGDSPDDPDDWPYEGLRNGQLKADMVPALNGANSDMAPKYLNDSRGGTNPPIRVMSYAEVLFLQAEGALQNWDMGGTAQDFYERGIEASMMERTAADGAAIQAYINSTNTPAAYEAGVPAASTIPIAWGSASTDEQHLEQIITQKWIALYPDGWEAWAEKRRTGYPVFYPRLNSDNPDVAPDETFRRMTFVTSEVNNNSTAVEAAEGLLENGPNRNDTRLWWDAKN